jgi:biopolymer transport protein TolQ
MMSQLFISTAATAATPVTAAPAAAAPEGLNYLQLILHASLPVQIIMVLLLVASVFSWIIIARKTRVFALASNEAEDFENRFWSGTDLQQLYRGSTERSRSISGMEAIFEAGFREFSRSRQKKVDARSHLESAQRAMRATMAREVDALEQNLELLANVGSTAPYIGLVGTVIGIMVSFHGLAQNKQATIASVAPGISAALIATAMGLFAAIPAV